MSVLLERLKKGVFTENPIFVLAIGMCPTLAVTSSAIDGMGMGLATTAVLIGSNLVISLLRNLIPDEIRIPSFIVIIAGFVTLIQFFMQAWAPALNRSLGIYIPLIVVNCIILGRAEAYASKNRAIPSIFDAVGMGLGFTVSLTLLGIIRELLGSGSVFNLSVMPSGYEPALIMILAPGAFLTLGVLMGIINYVNIRRKKINRRISEFSEDEMGCSGDCASCQNGGRS